MNKKIRFNRPSPKELGVLFETLTNSKPPEHNKVYTCDTPSPVIAEAEFAEMGGVLIAYPGTISQPDNQIQLPPSGPRSFGIPNELIIRMQQADTEKPIHIFILCADKDEYPKVIDSLNATFDTLKKKDKKLEFDTSLIHFVPWDTDTFWTRDYGPWWIYNNVTKYYGIAKHLYTSLGGGAVGMVEGAENVNPQEGHGIFRPNDDYAADKFSDYLNAPIRKWNKADWNGDKLEHIKPHNWYNSGLLNVGGNYMVTSTGTVSSSYLVAIQNELPSTKQPIDPQEPEFETVDKRMTYILEQLNRFMGIKKYIVLTDPVETYIGHIDCWGKFLSDDKILIAKSQNTNINKGLDEIADFFKKENFKVYRTTCQNIFLPKQAYGYATTAAYTNSLILNKCVYVPIVGGKDKNFDEEAIAAYQEALPDYTIVGIKGKPEYPWTGTDALHCRTRGVPRVVVDNWLKSQLLK